MKFTKLNSTLITVEQMNIDDSYVLNFNCWLGFSVNKKKYEISFEFDTNNELELLENDKDSIECTVWEEKEITIERVNIKKITNKDYKHVSLCLEFMGDVLNFNLNCVGYILSSATRIIEKDNTAYKEFERQVNSKQTTNIVAFI